MAAVAPLVGRPPDEAYPGEAYPDEAYPDEAYPAERRGIRTRPISAERVMLTGRPADARAARLNV
ncbi:hypothetical protein FHU37_005163 [Allostreptomyces psammosilenae]|uniref:Uncharacterized protein n=1 Tax=Allostreptomyces psammosilenae TaxID=1892865 RepID=A0A853A5K4_9ACTN|nr:hypothetical protein [Allostreptomyces psammosilenae]